MIDAEVEKLLRAGIINPCHASFSSPVILISKRQDEKGKPVEHRLVVDYRNLNANIKTSHVTIPQLHDFLDTLGRNKGHHIKYFTTLDCVRGYLQIRVHEESRNYTSFVTHSGQLSYLKIRLEFLSRSHSLSKLAMIYLGKSYIKMY